MKLRWLCLIVTALLFLITVGAGVYGLQHPFWYVYNDSPTTRRSYWNALDPEQPEEGKRHAYIVILDQGLRVAYAEIAAPGRVTDVEFLPTEHGIMFLFDDLQGGILGTWHSDFESNPNCFGFEYDSDLWSAGTYYARGVRGRPLHNVPAGGTWQWQVPFWTLDVLTGALLTLAANFAYRGYQARRRYEAGCCPTCGYDLRMHKAGEKCPECGAAVAATIE